MTIAIPLNHARSATAGRSERDRLEAAFDRHAASLYRFFIVRLSGDGHAADDCMQQLWTQALSAAAIPPGDEVERWLRVAAHNLLRTRWRKQGAGPREITVEQPHIAGELAQRMTTTELPAAWLEREEVRSQLMLAITALDSEAQELILEHYFHGRSQTQLATARGLTARAIEGRLYRARNALKQILEETARSAGRDSEVST